MKLGTLTHEANWFSIRCDNAPMESFFGRMKEKIGTKLFESKQAAAQAVFKYIELFYNPKRAHSSLGYLSPVAFETQHPA